MSRTLALIPARGGSKGLKRKNIRPIAGQPLIAWTIAAAKAAACLSRIVVSSEDEEILAVARACGAETPFVRPAHLALDATPSIEPVLHALDVLPERYEWIVLLQPTSPLRTGGDIDGAMRLCRERGACACVGITESVESPWWMFTRNPDDTLAPFMKRTDMPLRRQDLPATYSVNGAVYVARVEDLVREKTFFLPGVTGYVMPRERSVDIDDAFDFAVAEMLLETRKRAGDAVS